MFLATAAQHPLRDARHRAYFANAQKGLELEQTLEPGENFPMPMRGHILVHWPCRQALDQSMDQLLLQPVCRLAVGEHSRPSFGCAYGRSTEVAQPPASRRRRLPSHDEVRNGEPDSAKERLNKGLAQ